MLVSLLRCSRLRVRTGGGERSRSGWRYRAVAKEYG